jgi:hypothetical protein
VRAALPGRAPAPEPLVPAALSSARRLLRSPVAAGLSGLWSDDDGRDGDAG